MKATMKLTLDGLLRTLDARAREIAEQVAADRAAQARREARIAATGDDREERAT